MDTTMKDNNRRYVLGSTVLKAGITKCSKGFEIDPGAPYQMEFGIAWRSGMRTPEEVERKRKEQRA